MHEQQTIEYLEHLTPQELRDLLLQELVSQPYDPQYVKYILAAGADLIEPIYEGNTLLHYAVLNIPMNYTAEYIQIIQSILDAGASKEARNDQGQTPWNIASYFIKLRFP